MMRSSALVAALFAVVATTGSVSAQDPVAITLKGIAVDTKGPLANRVVMVMPIDMKDGKPVTRFSYGHSTLRKEAMRKSGTDPWTYFYVIAGDGPVLNPQAKTNAKGEFSVSVPLTLFSNPPNCATCTGYKDGELGLSIFIGTPGNLNSSDHDVVLVKVDSKTPTQNVGKVNFKSPQPSQ